MRAASRLKLPLTDVCKVLHTARRGLLLAEALNATPRERYLAALKSVIMSTPKDGASVADIAVRLEQALGDDADPERFGFPKLSHALMAVQDSFYIAGGDTLMPCKWSEIMRCVRQRLPVEGVLLPHFVQHVAHFCPRFEKDSLPGTSVPSWVKATFPTLIDVRQSRTSAEHVIFQRKELPHMKRVRQLHRALELLGRGDDIPAFTDVESLIPLLPSRNHDWTRHILVKAEITQAFDIDVDVIVEMQTEKRYLVFVDADSISPIERCRAFSAAGVPTDVEPVAVSSPDRVVDTSTDNAAVSVVTIRHSRSAAHSDNDIIVPAFMDTRDEMCAILSKLAQQSLELGLTVVVLVGDGAAASTVSMLKDTFSCSTLTSVTAATPTRKLI